MKRTRKFLFHSALLAIGPAVFTHLLLLVPGFTVESHSFRPGIPLLAMRILLLTAALAALRMLSIWILSDRLGVTRADILRTDALTWLPLVFLGASPLALSHFLGKDDLLARLHLLLAAVLIGIILLKIKQYQDLRRSGFEGGPAPLGFAETFSPAAKGIVVFLTCLVFFNIGSGIMIRNGALFTGDEPHYLLMTQSLLRDGDLDLAPDYDRKSYHEYLPESVTLQRHATVGRLQNARYSVHSPGTAVVLLPFYAAAGFLGLGKTGLCLLLRFGMSLFGALFCLQVFRLARRCLSDDRTAFAIVLLTALISPVFFYSIHVYPEILAALLSVTVFDILLFADRWTRTRLALAGLGLSLFIWLHAQKYLPLVAALGLYGLWTLMREKRRFADFAAFLAAPVAVTAAYFLFQYSIYGSFSLQAVSWWKPSGEALTLHSLFLGIPFRLRWETLVGYFLDQKDGLLFYAPVYLFAVPGMVAMFRKKAGVFRAVALLTLPYVLFSAFLTQRTGYAPQARPLTAVVWGLILPLGFYLSECKENSRRKSIFFSIFAFVGIVITIILIHNPLALYQETTAGTTARSGDLFSLLSNLHFDLTALLPSYAKSAEGPWLPNWVWPIVLAAVAGFFCLHGKKKLTDGLLRAVLAVTLGLVIFFAGFVFYPRTVIGDPVRTVSADGKEVTFYSLSRVARPDGPGRFLLPEDGRTYIFTFALPSKPRALKVSFGSTAGSYEASLDLFDRSLYAGKTDREIRSITVENPAAYSWKGRYLFWVTLRLSKSPNVRTSENPYAISIETVF